MARTSVIESRRDLDGGETSAEEYEVPIKHKKTTGKGILRNRSASRARPVVKKNKNITKSRESDNDRRLLNKKSLELTDSKAQNSNSRIVTI